jgi:hypothetical protein
MHVNTIRLKRAITKYYSKALLNRNKSDGYREFSGANCRTRVPSLESQTYASVQSKLGHVNCKTGKDLQDMFERYFHNVFLFSMNDEVVHTGFTPMAHYLIAVCTTPKSTTRVGTE